MRTSFAALSAAACVAATAACGGSAPRDQPPGADREWLANAAGVVDELQRDLDLGAEIGNSVRAARTALHAGLYTVLVAYTDFGGCRHMVASAGRAPTRMEAVSRSLSAACARLQRAAAIFTRAASANDAAALVRAGRVAASAAPLLVRAKVALQAAATTR
jgi:hypothetical protein